MPEDAPLPNADKSQYSALKTEQNTLWRRFHQLLEDLKSEKRGLSLTYDHIAKGLDLSRQRLYMFMKNPEQGLPIQRYNVLGLWEYITNPEVGGDAATAERRQRLRREEPYLRNQLLEAAGFLPVSPNQPELSGQIARIQRRLTSPLVDEDQLGDIPETILNLLSDRGTTLLRQSTRPANVAASEPFTVAEAKQWPCSIEELKLTPNSSVVQAYQQSIERFAEVGKISFSLQELFELYQGLDEHYALNAEGPQIRVIDCQFRSVSVLLTEQSEPLPEGMVSDRLRQQLETEYFQSEGWLRPQSPKQPNTDQKPTPPRRYPPVISASATVQIQPSSGELMVRYASSSTHIEAVLIALSEGLGSFLSRDSLTMDRMYVRSLGKSTESLVRASVTLSEAISNAPVSRTYEGLWVEQNAILCILQATSLAATRWLERCVGQAHLAPFYDLCSQVSRVQQTLAASIVKVFDIRDFRALTDDAPLRVKLSPTSPANCDLIEDPIQKRLQQDVIKELQRLAKAFRDLLQQPLDEAHVTPINESWYKTYRAAHHVKLDRKNLLAKVTLAHAQLTSAYPQQASHLLEELNNKLYRGDFAETTDPRFAAITALFVAAQTHYSLMASSEALQDLCQRPLSERVSVQDRIFEDFRTYTETVREGVIDFEIYLAAGSFCAAMALVTFYVPPCGGLNPRHELEQALSLFIRSAHYAAKIGHKQQARRYLCYASRLSARLDRSGTQSEAAGLLMMGRQVTSVSEPFPQPADFHLYLTQAELYLLSPTQGKDSSERRLKSLTCALWAYKLIHAPCLSALGAATALSISQLDAAYGLCRVLSAIADDHPPLTLSNLKDQLKAIDSSRPLRDINRAARPLVETVQHPQDTLAELIQLDCTCREAADYLQEITVNQLNRWHQDYRQFHQLENDDAAEHCLAAIIRSGQFLGKCGD